MNQIDIENMENNIFFKENNFILLKGNTLKVLEKIQKNSIDMIFADPPYFLSNDGITCKSGEMVSVNKGEWDRKESIQQVHQFNFSWLKKCKKILKDDGTIWISGTFHNIYSIGYALQVLDYKILNNIVWEKKAPPPNLGCRCFTHSNESIIWAKKSKNSNHFFNYDLMKEINKGKQMKDVWQIGRPKKEEKKFGSHPTQKPLNLLKRIIVSSTKEKMVVLDPFNGSGTTGIAAVNLDRNYVGIDIDEDYLNMTINRYKEKTKQMKLF